MELFWYIVIVVVLAIFFVLDGYDFGAGIIHLFFAKKEKDKVLVAKSAGLFWDSNEVWLVAGGGLIFMAFPKLYASGFSGFYLPLIFILWLIVFRAIGLELRGHFGFQMWKDIWDRAFGVSSLLLTLFFGIALGNIIRGVNLGGVKDGVSTYEPHYFFLPLWDASFSPNSDQLGVIDWFTLLIGVTVVLVLTIHGANWVVLKTNSSINKKLKSVVFNLSLVILLLSIVSVFAHYYVDHSAFDNFLDRPYLIVFPLVYFIGVTGSLLVKKLNNDKLSFAFSTSIIMSGIFGAFASIFPAVLPSSNEVNESLTIYNTAISEYGYSIAMIWGVLGISLIVLYFIVQKRLLGGKIDDMDYGDH